MIPILTAKAVKAAKPGVHATKPGVKIVKRIRDGKETGLCLVVSPAGAKSYSLQYTSPEISGKRRYMLIGKAKIDKDGDITLEQARTAASDAKKKIRAGVDPIEEKLRQEAAAAAALKAVETAKQNSVDNLFQVYFEYQEVENSPTVHQVRSAYTKHIKAPLGGMPANQVTRKDVIGVISTIVAAGHLSMANHVQAYLRAAFQFGLDIETYPQWHHFAEIFDMKANPAAGIKKQAANQAGDTYLTKNEMRVLWNGIGKPAQDRKSDMAMSFEMALALKLLITTGQRVQEVIGAKWEEFDFESNVWSIPIERRKVRKKALGKHRKPHVVPLEPLHIELLKELHHINGSSPYLFPHQDGGKPKNYNALTQAVTRFCVPKENSPRKPFKRFSPRDIRRTWKTFAGEAQLDTEIKNRIQGHAFSDVASVHYDEWGYINEKRAGMRKWVNWFNKMLVKEVPDKVVQGHFGGAA